MTIEQYVSKGSFYETVVEDGSDLIFIVDFQGNIIYHNASVFGTLGYKSRSLIGRNFFDHLPPNTVLDLKNKFKQSEKKDYTEKVEFQFLCTDGTYKFLEFNAINLKYKNNISGFILDCRDISQRKRDAEELVKLQKAKEQFLANISHEIRTPINGIAGMASLLSESTGIEERETYLNAIKHSAENLKVIINDILDLAAIESGKFRFEKIAFNLKDLLPSLISTFAYQAKEKKLTLQYSIDESLNRILLGDPVRLNQVLINLISNAVKFTHSGSINITCNVERTQKDVCWIRIEVADTGVGIPEEKLNTIFESFSQADASVTRKYGGSGLGLTIVKQLVELQNGKITVRSEELKGSTFIVLIPYAIGKARNLTQATSSTKLQPSEALIKELAVLLVEDNDINRLYAKSILKNWNCHTDIAENGLVAIEKVKNNFYDVVLMDVQMPVMDGYEATKAIRLMNGIMKDVPIIALTANTTKKDIESCLSVGMNDYLPKPFTPEDLQRKIFEDLKITPSHKNSSTTNERRQTMKYDFTYLKSVSENNEEFIKEMIQTFIQTIPGVLIEMTTSVTEKDWEKLAKLAHQIKPSLALMGMTDLRAKVVYIEKSGKARENLNDLPAITQSFIQSCEEIIPELNKLL